MSKNAASKTLYTARFFEAPSSSDSTRPSSSKPQPSAYLNRLSETHIALNHMEEVPDSRSNTPEQADLDRVEALRAEVAKAFNDAKGNPASGKWGILANLLQTGTSKGKYRYINTRTDVAPPEPGPDGWILAETEEEWFAWERRRKAELLKVKKKKEEELALEAQRREEEMALEAQRKDEEDRLKEVKRLEDERLKEKVKTWQRSVNADGMKASSSRPSKSTKSVPSDDPKPIAELPESFLPPSFPSNLETSTPVAVNRHKPSPIGKELVPSSSPPLSSPIKKRPDVPKPSWDSPTKLSVADEVPSSSPLSSPPKNSRVYGRPRPSESPLKRPRSPSPSPVVAKKSRPVLPSPPAPDSGSGPSMSRTPSKPDSKPPVTPPRSTLPKLQDLIAASAQKKSMTKGKGKAKEKPRPKPKSPSPEPPSPQVKEEDEDEADEEEAEERRRLDLEAGIDVMEQDVINWDHTLEQMSTKLAENAHGSMPHFSNGEAFDPQGASTQPMGRLEGAGESAGTARGGFGQPQDFGFPMTYESQMDVESNMQGVEELLDADVGGYTVGGPWMGTGPDKEDDDEHWGGGQIESSP
ncbi:hypothetical protein B0H11DRAFT_2276812 [Mycena galericulata]|nr:hypothetical protein B0H11DRAFT_2276812 [Mycena galericulata]